MNKYSTCIIFLVSFFFIGSSTLHAQNLPLETNETEVDLIWEANTYTHPLYKGKSLSPSGSMVKIVAIPHVPNITESELVYKWSYNNRVYADRSGIGRDVFNVAVSPRNATVSVEILDKDGNALATGSTFVKQNEPLARVYRAHPLKGVLIHESLDREAIYALDEVSLAVFPFFFSTSSANSENIEYSWRVNNRPVDVSRVLTVRKEIREASSNIDLSISNKINVFEESGVSFIIRLTQSEL